MGTFIKYLFYLILLAVIYLVGRGIYDGSITRETSVGNVIEQVDEGGRELIQETGKDVRRGYNKATGNTPDAAAATRPVQQP